MTIDDAIKFNQALRNDLRSRDIVDLTSAIQLGIEALKAIEHLRRHKRPGVIGILPGETEE